MRCSRGIGKRIIGLGKKRFCFVGIQREPCSFGVGRVNLRKPEFREAEVILPVVLQMRWRSSVPLDKAIGLCHRKAQIAVSLAA